MNKKYLTETCFITLALLLQNKPISQIVSERKIRIEYILKHILEINTKFKLLKDVSLNHMKKCPQAPLNKQSDIRILNTLYTSNMFEASYGSSYNRILLCLQRYDLLDEIKITSYPDTLYLKWNLRHKKCFSKITFQQWCKDNTKIVGEFKNIFKENPSKVSIGEIKDLTKSLPVSFGIGESSKNGLISKWLSDFDDE
jgi:DNA-binding CsgD family transcriptional regulator